MMDFHSILFLLFDVMLYVRGKQLWSCWDDQLLNLTAPGQSNRRRFISIKYTFFSKVTDNLNQRNREIIVPRKNVPDARINRGTAAFEADTLSTELLFNLSYNNIQ